MQKKSRSTELEAPRAAFEGKKRLHNAAKLYGFQGILLRSKNRTRRSAVRKLVLFTATLIPIFLLFALNTFGAELVYS